MLKIAVVGLQTGNGAIVGMETLDGDKDRFLYSRAESFRTCS
jgi:hypothetical protein